jgi:hypothetical protein
MALSVNPIEKMLGRDQKTAPLCVELCVQDLHFSIPEFFGSRHNASKAVQARAPWGLDNFGQPWPDGPPETRAVSSAILHWLA